jgi:predicted enzyme related to lactoylglutathione lyase
LRIIINVLNLDEAAKGVVEEGGKILIPKRENPAMYWSVILDTEGNQVDLIERISQKTFKDIELFFDKNTSA